MSLIYIQTYSAVYQNRTKKTTSIRQSVYIIPFLSIPDISLHIYLFRACGYNYIIGSTSSICTASNAVDLFFRSFVGWCCPSNKWRRTGNTKNEQFNACQQYIYSSQPKISVHHQEFRDGPEAAQLPCITRINQRSVRNACVPLAWLSMRALRTACWIWRSCSLIISSMLPPWGINGPE